MDGAAERIGDVQPALQTQLDGRIRREGRIGALQAVRKVVVNGAFK